MADGHLRRRGTIYWFRQRVPHSLITRFGMREIHRSLRTSSLREAKGRAKQAWLATQTTFRTMKLNPKLLAAQASALIDQLLDEAVLASPTADELVESLASDGGNYHELLLNINVLAAIMSLPGE